MWGAEYLSRFVEREELGGWMGRRWFVGVWIHVSRGFISDRFGYLWSYLSDEMRARWGWELQCWSHYGGSCGNGPESSSVLSTTPTELQCSRCDGEGVVRDLDLGGDMDGFIDLYNSSA